MQDAFRLTLVMLLAALIAVLLIRTKQKQAAPAFPAPLEDEERAVAARAEAMLIG